MMASIVHLLVLVCVVPSLAAGKHSIPTFSHRVGPSDELEDVNHPSFKTHLQYPFAGKSADDPATGQMTVSKALVSSGDTVSVSWAGIADARISDWIGIYSPANSSEMDYLDYQWANVSSSWKTGSGEFPVKLFNMRVDYGFRYYQTINGKHYVKATAHVAVEQHEACGGRLSLGNDIDTMALMWTTDSEEDLIVQYSLSESFEHFMEVPGSQISTRTYAAKDMCGPPATLVSATTYRDPGFQVLAYMTNLTLDTLYYYRFGTKGFRLVDGHFHTPMRPGQAEYGRFITFGDFGVHYHPQVWQQPGAPMIGNLLAKEALSKQVDAILHFGDLAYGVGHGYIWDQWNWLMSQSARYTPYMVGVGNHEYDHLHAPPSGVDVSGTPGIGFHPSWGNHGNDAQGECGVPTFHRFKMPAEHNGGNSVFWYSFDLHLVRVIMMSSEHDYSPGTLQYKWLESVLSSTDRKVLPWVVVTLHRPMYSNESDSHSDNVVANHERELFEDLIVKYKVNIMFSGHYHSYMRSCPVIKNVCKEPGTAPVHVVAGTAGAALQSPSSTFPAPWTVFGAVKFGYAVFEVNTTHLHMDWMSQDLDTQDLHVADFVDVPLWKD
ncbi:uncharacterized protein LOC135825837 [Sycon ciliatum]|uniref:uncharacterized protein LOC135825837 n=1 Tax=Sycon ciliatum TaxID=27933 RepID=UPI0020AD6D74|eukprot:scpid60006/ scgid26004/ Probable inactive purple acid phosphatase 2